LYANETAVGDTPAWRATSRNVTRFLFLLNTRFPCLDFRPRCYQPLTTDHCS